MAARQHCMSPWLIEADDAQVSIVNAGGDGRAGIVGVLKRLAQSIDSAQSTSGIQERAADAQSVHAEANSNAPNAHHHHQPHAMSTIDARAIPAAISKADITIIKPGRCGEPILCCAQDAACRRTTSSCCLASNACRSAHATRSSAVAASRKVTVPCSTAATSTCAVRRKACDRSKSLEIPPAQEMALTHSHAAASLSARSVRSRPGSNTTNVFGSK
eukprot:CAMPEP_0119336652 /NCGR_PEP_ID=MMETSP1333-20130426/92280_1 /TAXON_ID=418940 /ORGANISM="Scyphosphaera apsteinii, Strain RCC1455" /LENGTH=216 /DNA_ID=CAMNT_0007347497 /DNA_START=910 /DNA_END=1558 /DNA_ORIENTATION=-